MISVFDYVNYRHFLNDYLAGKKKDKKFSQRSIARALGIQSSGFISNVITGRNNLTSSTTIQLASVLDLSKNESEYFQELVLFTQAKTLSEKHYYLERMLKVYKSKFRTLKPNQMSLFSHWHFAIIRELIFFYECNDDYKALAKMIEPSITPSQAQEALEELEKIGLIAKDDTGIYRHQQGTVSTGDEIRNVYVAQFQKQTMQQAQHALETIPAKERDISVLTLKLSDEMFAQIKTEIQLFRKKLLAMAESDSHQKRVFQVNINFFPCTRKEDTNEVE